MKTIDDLIAEILLLDKFNYKPKRTKYTDRIVTIAFYKARPMSVGSTVEHYESRERFVIEQTESVKVPDGLHGRIKVSWFYIGHKIHSMIYKIPNTGTHYVSLPVEHLETEEV